MFWFQTSGYTQPSTLYMADATKVESGEALPDFEEVYVEKEMKSLPAMYDATGLKVVQRFAVSEDGTEIPYFLVMKEDTVLDGNTPTLLYGYGGFEISLGPKYIATAGISWLERGGAYVEANIRGGGEFGPSWHQVRFTPQQIKKCDSMNTLISIITYFSYCLVMIMIQRTRRLLSRPIVTRVMSILLRLRST
jgi:prolyl oligopeptidase